MTSFPLMDIRRLALLRGAPPPTEDASNYPARLSELAALLQGVPWLLAGGLTVPLTVGKFYRRHHDVDIAFPLDVFPDVQRVMLRAGYYLSTYFPLSFFGRCRFAVSIPISATGWFARHRPRKLKFRDETGQRCAPNLLAVIEALPYRIADGCLVTCDGRRDAVAVPRATVRRGASP